MELHLSCQGLVRGCSVAVQFRLLVSGAGGVPLEVRESETGSSVATTLCYKAICIVLLQVTHFSRTRTMGVLGSSLSENKACPWKRPHCDPSDMTFVPVRKF